MIIVGITATTSRVRRYAGSSQQAGQADRASMAYRTGIPYETSPIVKAAHLDTTFAADRRTP